MTELKIPNDLVVEAAGLLERRPPELEAEDIVDALRRLHDGRSEEPTPDDPTEEHTRRLRELEERYGRVHEAIEGRLARSPAGKRLLAERARLGDKLQEIAERVRGEEISDAQGSSEVVDLVERLQLAHRREVLQVATESADQHPSLEVLLQVLHPDEDLLAQRVVWDAQVAPFQAIVLKPTAGDDLADVRQGLREPTPLHRSVSASCRRTHATSAARGRQRLGYRASLR
jgi:hypothetical protein